MQALQEPWTLRDRRTHRHRRPTQALSLLLLSFLRPLEIAGQSKQRERLESLQWPLLPEPLQKFFINQFGEDFPKLCNDEPVSPDSETWQALQNTALCSGDNVENDAVGEEEAMLRVRQAVLTYASSRVQRVLSTNPKAYENETPDDVVEGSGQASGLLANAASRMRQVPPSNSEAYLDSPQRGTKRPLLD